MIEIHKIVRAGDHNFNGAKLDINNRWNLKLLENLLLDYKDKEIAKYLRYGWPINHDGRPTSKAIPRNHKGALEHMEDIDEYLEKEIRLSLLC